MKDLLVEYTIGICEMISSMPEEESIEALNQIRTMLHGVSPMKHHPVDLVLWIPADEVHANNYNPNSVAPPEMKSLAQSVRKCGITMPVVTADLKGDEEGREVTDGFHRRKTIVEKMDILKSTKGRVPVTRLPDDFTESDKMAATMLHNTARGKHSVIGDAEIVSAMVTEGWSDDRIRKELGKTAEELLRLKQSIGVAEILANQEYDKSWKW